MESRMFAPYREDCSRDKSNYVWCKWFSITIAYQFVTSDYVMIPWILCLWICVCKAGDKNVNIFSNPLDNVLGHTLAFKVRVQPKYKNSFVQKISDDPTVIRVILDFLSNEEVLKSLTPYTVVLKSFPLKFYSNPYIVACYS